MSIINSNILSGPERKKAYMEEKPSFFYDNSERDEAEMLLDFYLSYTLRCAVDHHPNIHPRVNEYAKLVLFCIFGEVLKSTNNITIKDVRTWKQWERIDLVAEIDLVIDKEDVSYAIIFENKLYTKIHNEQLTRYRKSAEKFYLNHKEKSNYKIIYRFLSALEDIPPEDISACEDKNANFKPLTFQDLREAINSNDRTGESLFDEFWFRYY
jgi:hypothetical protein